VPGLGPADVPDARAGIDLISAQIYAASSREYESWACHMLPQGPTTPLCKSSAGSFAFLDVRHEKSENGFPCVSYGVAKAKRSPPKRTRSARAYAAFDHCNDGAREVLDLAHWSPERIIPPSGYLAGGD
jgi:hypothetical protein